MNTHFAIRVLFAAVGIAGSLITAFTGLVTADSAGPKSQDPNNPYEIEVVGPKGSWDPATDTWTQTKRTKGGDDDYCQWEWTKTWVIDEETVPFWVGYSNGGVPIQKKSMSLFAFGALFGGTAFAWDISSGNVDVHGGVIGRGTVEVRLVSKPPCDNCTQTISAEATPGFKAETTGYNNPATGEAAGYAKVHGTNLTGLSSEAKAGVVTEDNAPNQYQIAVGPVGVTVTINSSGGNDIAVGIGSSSDTKNIDWERIHFVSGAHLKAVADGYFTDEGEISASLHSGSMATEITAACNGCCKGWVKIVITNTVD